MTPEEWDISVDCDGCMAPTEPQPDCPEDQPLLCPACYARRRSVLTPTLDDDEQEGWWV